MSSSVVPVKVTQEPEKEKKKRTAASNGVAFARFHFVVN